MKAREIRELFDALYLGKEINIAEDSKTTYEFCKKIAEYEALQGSEYDDAMIKLLDNDLFFDGVDQRQFFENLMGYESKGFDINGAKKIWLFEELKLFGEAE